jgi:enoyl-CoA hydratase/carnithine racemase
LYQRITVDLDDHVLLIGINRPDKRNAFDLAALEQLSAAYQRLGEDAQARVGVLYAHGAHFSAGLDLGEVGPVVAERAAVAHLRELLPVVLGSEDAAEGLRSFIERRAGRFTGQ